MTTYEKWKRWQYYILVGVISLVALFVVPMIGTQASLTWNIPNTTAGWIVYIFSKLLVAATNILIFHCFVCQGKTNILPDPRYKEACKRLGELEDESKERPLSPDEWYRETYGKKGITVFITTLLSSIGLAQAVLAFDLTTFITYFITILGGLIFGVLQMNQTEVYWTETFPLHVNLKLKEQEIKKRDKNKQCGAPQLGGASTEEQTGHSEALSGDTASS